MFKAWCAFRSLIFYAFIAVTLCVGVPFIFLLALFPFRFRFKIIKAWTFLMRHACRWICGIRFKIEGLQHVPKGPVMIFSRHESAWETLVFSDLFPMNCFVVKKQLLNIPVFGWAFRVSKHIAIDRDRNVSALKQMIREGESRVKEGISIIIFPEGTRMPPQQFRPFHKGGATLAKAMQLPIIPVVHNAGRCWKRQGFIKYPGLVRVIIGEPISIHEKNVDEINKAVYSWMESHYPNAEKE